MYLFMCVRIQICIDIWGFVSVGGFGYTDLYMYRTFKCNHGMLVGLVGLFALVGWFGLVGSGGLGRLVGCWALEDLVVGVVLCI